MFTVEGMGVRNWGFGLELKVAAKGARLFDSSRLRLWGFRGPGRVIQKKSPKAPNPKPPKPDALKPYSPKLGLGRRAPGRNTNPKNPKSLSKLP